MTSETTETLDVETEVFEFSKAVGRKSAKTSNTYGRPLRQFLKYLDGEEATRDRAQQWVDSLLDRGLAGNTVATYANSLRRYFTWRKGETIKLDAPGISMPEVRYHSYEDIVRMLDSVTPLESALVAVMFYSGARISEVTRLNMSDLHLDEGYISVIRKGGRDDNAMLASKANPYIERWLERRKGSSKTLFWDWLQGDNLEAKNNYVRRLLRPLARRCGIKTFRPHDLRHSWAIYLSFTLKMPLDRVSAFLGHRSMESTRRYQTLEPSVMSDELEGYMAR